MVDKNDFPVDWEVDVLGNCVRIETGSKNTEDKIDNGRYPFFVRSQKVEHIDTYHYDCEAVLTAGDGVGTGKVFHYYNGKFDVHQRVYVLSEFDKVIGRFLYYYFKMNFLKEVEKYTAKSSVDSVRRDMISKMQIPIPGRKEQETITKILSNVDSLITSLQKLIDKKKAIKQGAMQELLTGKKRLPGYSGEWRRVKLGDCIIEQPLYGVNAPAVRYNPIFPTYIRITDITEEGKFSHSDKASVIYNNYRNYLLKNHDIVLARTGASVGKSYLYDSRDGQLVYAGFLIKISINPQVANDKFVFYSLHTKKYWDWVGIVSMRSGQPGINSVEYASFEFELPPINEQNAIAQILTDMDNEIEQLEKKLAKYQQIRQGMMQELLTGHIRLIDDVEET